MTISQLPTDVWGFLAVVVFTAATVWGESARTRRRVKRVQKTVEPVGNGFSAEVTESLARLEAQVGEIGRKVDEHISDHVRGSILRG